MGGGGRGKRLAKWATFIPQVLHQEERPRQGGRRGLEEFRGLRMARRKRMEERNECPACFTGGREVACLFFWRCVDETVRRSYFLSIWKSMDRHYCCRVAVISKTATTTTLSDKTHCHHRNRHGRHHHQRLPRPPPESPPPPTLSPSPSTPLPPSAITTKLHQHQH